MPTSDARTAPAGTDTATRAALVTLAETLQAVASELGGLAQRAVQLADLVAADRPLTEVMASEERPLIVTTLTRILDELADAGAGVRRAEAQQLRAEGLSHGAIAQIFGVSRQRAAALLAPPPPPGARAVKRPAVGMVGDVPKVGDDRDAQRRRR
ncbi:MAG: hypothetical protein ACTHNT_11835 [Actinomycetales bacterium]